MKIFRTISEFRQERSRLLSKDTGAKLGFVPTMGALHEGHISLVRAARERCSVVAVSIFVNPAQFGPNEDFDRYPRTFDADCAMLEREGVDLLFAPGVSEMYPHGRPTTFVEVAEIGDRLDGASRPGHFRGVTTVVAKLFHIVQPHFAFFGQKDAAQVAVLRAMVRDLDFPLEILPCPTFRDRDGLAMSSRNRYLSAEQRTQALALSRSLFHARESAANGERNGATLRNQMAADLNAAPGVRLDYAEVVSRDTLLPLATMEHGALLAVAAWVGDTRLIDNVVLEPVQ